VSGASFSTELMAFDWLSGGSFVLARIITDKLIITGHSSNASLIAAHRFRKLSRGQIAAGLCIPLKEADAVGVTQDYIAERDRPRNKVLFARDVLADLMGVKGSEEEPLDGALDNYEVTETSIQAVYAAKIGSSQERLAKVRGDYGIRQKAALDKLTPNLKRNVVKKIISIGLGLDFLLSTTSNIHYRKELGYFSANILAIY
jgi:hypothetical protein